MFPILYQSNDLILYSYPLLMGVGWGVGYQIFFSLHDLSTKLAQILFWGIFLLAWVGSKVFFLINSSTESSTTLAYDISFWTGGGFVFYGGLIFVLVFLGIWRIRFPLTLHTLWSLLVALTFGHAIGRLGCFLAGCCYGAPTTWPWGIFLHGTHRHPTQLLESFSLLILGWFLIKKRTRQNSVSLYFICYGVLRLTIEALRGDAIRGLWGPLTPSQWISLALIFGGVFISKFKLLGTLETIKSSLTENHR